MRGDSTWYWTQHRNSVNMLRLMNAGVLSHHNFLCHLCLLGSGVLLVNTVIMFVLLPGAEVHRVLGNVAGKICRQHKDIMCY